MTRTKRTLSLALLLAPAVFPQVDERCPGTAFDRGPSLLGSFEPLNAAGRQEGFQGRLSFQLTVTETGTTQDARVTNPTRFDGSVRIKGEIAKLRFCPAVKSSRYREATAKFDIQVE